MTPQHLRALAQANQVRFAAADYLASIRHLSQREGLHRLADTLEGRLDAAVGSIALDRFLRAAAFMGQRKIVDVIWRAKIPMRSATTRLRHLSREERKRLAQELRRRADRIRR